VSQENVEVVRLAVDAFNRRDMARLADLSDQDFEFVSVLTAVEAQAATYRGLDGWTRYFADIDQAWKNWHIVGLRVFDCDGDTLAATFRVTGEGRQSKAPVERAVGITYRVRGGKIWQMRSFLDPAQALKAVGLEE
jgi:ketosteroid isomerase-like protein